MSKTDLAKKVMGRFEALKKRRLPWESLWDEVIEMTCPSRGKINDAEDSAKKRGGTLYSSDAQRALKVWSSGMKGYLVSPAFPWFRLTMSDPDLDDNPMVRYWLEKVTAHMMVAFQRSNFYSAIDEYFRDGGSIGTATMFSTENIKTESLHYSVRHPREIFISEDAEQNVDTIFRYFRISYRNLVSCFGVDKLPETYAPKFEKSPYTTIPILHAVMPASEMGGVTFNRPVGSVYVLPDDDWELSQSGFHMLPASCWRTIKNADEEYGYSPGTEAICEILGLNSVSKSILQIAQLLAEPPMNAPEEMRGKVRFNPRGINWYQDATRTVSPINMTTDLRGAMDRENKGGQAVREHFHVDFFLMLNQAEKVMTATEIMERQGEKAVVLGSDVDRLPGDVLEPQIDRCFDVEMRAGRLPPPPRVLLERPGRIDVDYLGPLAQIQKRHFKTQGITSAQAALFPMAAAYPDALLVINEIKTAKAIVVAAGMPQELLRSDDEIAELVEQRQKRQDALQQAEMAKTLATAANQGRREIEPNSLAQMALQAVESD